MPPHDAPSTFLTRVRLRDYRSIARCDVALEPLTILVGPNGAGKSNFLDALRFTTEGLRDSLEHALRERGGFFEVCRKDPAHDVQFGVRLDFLLEGQPGHFAFAIHGNPNDGAFVVSNETCAWKGSHYEVRIGDLVHRPAVVSPPASSDRLYLGNAAGLPAFRPVFDALSTMGFYNPSPASLREPHARESGELLDRDGGNLASVLARLDQTNPLAKQRIDEYMARVVPGIEGVTIVRIGRVDTVEFRQRIAGAPQAWSFPASNMSDGTLRALAVLTALFQFGERRTARLVGIEEPETALHPAALGLLMDGLREGVRDRQVVITTHSPDLLDSDAIASEQLLSVIAVGGRTIIGAVDAASRDALRDSLYRPGELLRLGQLEPDPASISDADDVHLFEPAS